MAPPSVMIKRVVRRRSCAVVVAAMCLVAVPAFVWPSASRADAQATAAQKQTRFGGARPAAADFLEPSGTASEPSSSGAGRWLAAFMSAVVLATMAPQPAFAKKFTQRKDDYVATTTSSFGDMVGDTDEEIARKKAEEAKKAEKAEEAFYAENRAELLEESAEKRRGEAKKKLEEAEQKSKAERLMRQLDATRTESENKKVAALEEQSKKGQAVLKQLEQKKDESTAGKGSAAPVDNGVAAQKPKAWAAFSNFFKGQEEKKIKEEKKIEVAELKRQAVLDELTQRKAAAERAAKEAEEVAAKIEELARQAREAAERAKKAVEQV